MRGPDPADYGWWLASRGAGVVALLCITASVGLGLAMAGRVSRNPKAAGTLIALHQHTALVGLVAIAVHGITLLGDHYLDPGLTGIAVPFVIDHAQVWTGIGVTGGWLAAALGLSYWARDRIGAARWRRLHRATLLVYLTSVAHTLGSGSDAGEPWMRVLLLVTGAPILFLFIVRVLPAPSPAAAAPRLRRFRVAAITPESSEIASFALEPVDGRPLEPFAAGQFLTVAVDVPGRGRETRSYSLSGPADPGRHRISVKREPGGAVSGHLHAAVAVGDVLEAAGPSGVFVLDEAGRGPVVLLSAGVGATPVLAMLHRLAAARSEREVWWVHGARCGRDHPFRGEVRQLLRSLPAGRSHVRYSRPDACDEPGRDFDAAGRVTAEAVRALGIPDGAEYYLCGPSAFLDDLTEGLAAAGVPRELVRSERFGAAAPPPPPTPAVAFTRSGVRVAWDERFTTLLELAEAHDVPAASGCRVGACHGCRAEVVEGSVRHEPEPLQPPPPGTALLCCAKPEGDVALDC